MAYEKQTWDTNSYVNPTRMNHIENGIKENSDEVGVLKQNIDDLRAIHSKKITVTNVPCNTAWGGTYISASKSYDISDLPISQAKSIQVTWIGEVTSFMTVESISNVLKVVFLRGTQASAISGTIYIDCIM